MEKIEFLTNVGRAFRHRNYRLYFIGQLISVIGTWMQQVAQSWLVYRLTGSASVLGEITFASQIPQFLLSPVAGVLADRYNRRHLLLITQSVSMLPAMALAILTFTKLVTVGQVEVLAVLLGIVNALDVPVRQAFIVEMVGKEDLPNAIALNSSMFNAARLIGPAIAGLTVAAVGEAWCFALNAASFLAVLAGLMMIRLPPWHASPVKGSLLQQAADGFAYCISIMPLRAMFLMVGVLSFAGAPYTMLMPVFAEKLLGGNAATVGLLMAANGLGALFGALLLASRKSLKGSAQRIVLASILFGGALIGFAWSHSYTLSLVMLVAVGFAMITLVGSCNTMIQSMVSEDYRGRVMAVYAMVLFGFAPFGSLLAGKMSEHWGAPLVVTGGALCCVVSGLVLQAMLPAVREQARALMAQRRLE